MATTLSTPAPSTTVADDPKRPYKFIVAAIISVCLVALPVVQTALGDGWSADDTITVILAVLGAVGVYFVENPKVDAKANGL